jgi:GT2 family glycosyltransferase
MQRPNIDIIIVNYRGATDTLQALARLAEWPHGTLWLVDNSAHEPDMAADTAALQQAVVSLRATAGTANTPSVIASEARQSMDSGVMDRHGLRPRDDENVEQPCVKLLTPGANLGFGRACNLAFAASSAEFVLLLNPDARICADDVLLLARTLTEQPRLAGVSPKIYWNEERSFVLPAAFAQTPWYYVAQALATRSRRIAQWAARRGLQRAMRQMAGSKVFEVDFVAGSVLLLRRSAVLQAGGLFDPDYFMFFEDSDLSLRLRHAGYELAIVPGATAQHEYRHKAFKAELMAQSQQHYFRKQSPLFYRCSGQLSRVPQLAGAVDLNAWFKVLAQPVNSAEEFAHQTGGAGVLAFSPTMLLMPAIFRPSAAQARPFDAQEWALLEPGPYTALLVGADSSKAVSWVYFRKA